MKIKNYGYIAVMCLALCIAWLAFMIISMAGRGSVDTLDDLIAAMSKPDLFNFLNYVTVAVLTITVTVLFTGIYAYCRSDDKEIALAGFIFVPVYCAFNLIAYLSQITLVPALIAGYQVPEYRSMARLLLEQAIQFWPGSFMLILNNLAYAVLGISSIAFGFILVRRGRCAMISGWLLMLNAIACILGFIGIIGSIKLLEPGSMIGGIVFTVALIPLTLMFFKEGGVSD